MPISFAGLSGGGGKVQKIDKITSTQTWTAPDDVQSVDVILVGGGGGGFGYSNNNTDDHERMGGGGGGGVLRETLAVTPGSTYTIEIGAGGATRNLTSGTPESEFYAFPGGATNFGNLAKAGGGLPSMYYQDHGDLYTYANNNSQGPNWLSLTETYGSAGGNNAGARNNTADSEYSGGGGGGAGTPAMAGPKFSTGKYTFYNSANSNGPLPSGTFPLFGLQSQGNPGGQASRFSNTGSMAQTAGGLGTPEGWGAGGGGGIEYLSYWGGMARFKASGNGGQGAVSTSLMPANAGAINTGAGGGGGARNSNNNLKMSGGAGGSGLAIIKYWTAE